MSSFILTVVASASFSGGNAPSLQVLIGGTPVSAQSIASGSNTYTFFIDYSGSYPASMQLQFDPLSGDPGDTITMSEVRVNGQDITSDLTATLLAFGAAGSYNTAAGDYLFGREEATSGDLGTPTHTGSGNVHGSANANIINASAANDRVRGVGGDDAIAGGAGDDTIFGEAGNDMIIGEGGNDNIYGGIGDDLVYGGDNNDTLVGEAGNDVLNGGLGNDSVFGDAGNDILYGEAGVDMLVGGTGNDYLFGDDGNDTLIGGTNDDTMLGGNNDDQLHGGAGADDMYGEAGSDLMTGGAGNDEMFGGADADEMYGDGGDDQMDGGTEDDYLNGGTGNDTIDGDDGIDVIIGGTGADIIDGGIGDDILHGHGLDAAGISSILFANPNVVYSQETGSFYQYVNTNSTWSTANTNALAATLSGVAGHLAVITSQAENDLIQSMLDGGESAWLAATESNTTSVWQWTSGAESGIQFSNAATATYNMYENWLGGEPNASNAYARLQQSDGTWTDRPNTDTYDYVIEWEAGLFSDDSIADTISGGAGNDFIYGYGGNDTLNGDANNDVLVGGAGADTLNGGTGTDTLLGGAGADIMDGGNDNDTIILANGDFASGESITGGGGTDVILLSNATTVDFSTGTLATVETLTGSTNGDDTVTLSATQFANLTTINLISGTDVLNVTASGNISALGTPTVSNVDTGNLVGTGGNDSVILTGAQLNAILTGAGTIDLGAGATDTINLTSTSSELNTLGATDGSITGVEFISASTAGAGVTITLTGQTEAFNVTGGGSADTITLGAGADTADGGAGGDTISGGTGSDTINGGAGNDILSANAAFSTPYTALNVNFNSSTDGFSYSDGFTGVGGSDGSNVDVTGPRNTTDGYGGNGSLEVLIDSTGNPTGPISGHHNITVNFTSAMTNGELSFAYRMFLDGDTDNNEDLYLYVTVDGTTYGLGGNAWVDDLQGAGGNVNQDTGWLTATLSIGALSTGNHTIRIGAYLTDASDSAEDAWIRFDDVLFTDNVASGSNDDGAANTLNGGNDNDTLYGSTGNDILNGDAGTDTLYSGSEDTQTALINSLATGGIVYNSTTGNFYQYVSTAVTAPTAFTDAAAATLNGVAGHVAFSNSATENAYLDSISGTATIWLGGQDTATEGAWLWVGNGYSGGLQFWSGVSTGNSPYGYYTNWGGGEPNDYGTGEDYVEMTNGGTWNDNGGPNQSALTRGYVIEWEGSLVLSGLETNTLNGGAGNDNLYGNDGVDIFYFDNTTSIDTIYGFDIADRDKIDLSDIISFNPLTDSIANFVQFGTSGGNTTVSVDANGTTGGTAWTQIATINGVTGLSVQDLIMSDNLIVA